MVGDSAGAVTRMGDVTSPETHNATFKVLPGAALSDGHRAAVRLRRWCPRCWWDSDRDRSPPARPSGPHCRRAVETACIRIGLSLDGSVFSDEGTRHCTIIDLLVVNRSSRRSRANTYLPAAAGLRIDAADDRARPAQGELPRAKSGRRQRSARGRPGVGAPRDSAQSPTMACSTMSA
jgi:hypothetical protein